MNTNNSRQVGSPYLCGGLAGLLMAASVVIAGKYFGASTSYVRNAGFIERAFDTERVMDLAYFAKYFQSNAGIDWQWMFVVGVLVGALVLSLITGTFKVQAVPPDWARFRGGTPASRAIWAFVGGLVMVFGARMAGGCPSGHGLSGLMQLSISGFVALVCFFIGGVVVAQLLYRR